MTVRQGLPAAHLKSEETPGRDQVRDQLLGSPGSDDAHIDECLPGAEHEGVKSGVGSRVVVRGARRLGSPQLQAQVKPMSTL